MHLGWQVELESLRCDIFESLSKAWTTYHQIQIGGNQGTMTTFEGFAPPNPQNQFIPRNGRDHQILRPGFQAGEFWPCLSQTSPATFDCELGELAKSGQLWTARAPVAEASGVVIQPVRNSSSIRLHDCMA